MKQVLVASTGLNAAVMQMLTALQEQQLLALFTTTLAVDNDSALLRLVPRLANRVVHGIPAARVACWRWPELLRLLCARIDRTGLLADRLWEWTDYHFAQRAARQLNQADSVLGFEHSSLELFQQARQRGLACFYNVPSAHSGLITQLLAQEASRYGGMRTGNKRLDPQIDSRRQARRDEEFALADVVIAHSSFCKRSYVAAGFAEEKIRVINFGAPPVPQSVIATIDAAPGAAVAGPPVFLFAGNFAAHKGAHVLLDAWRRLPAKGARLLIAGDNFLPPRFWQPEPAGVELLGRLPWPQLQRLYATCTALVLPSFSDGFGMVVTEALANGLPVITTPNTGASDLIVDGCNGLVVPVGDAVALANALARVMDDTSLVRAMRREAIATAQRWQWRDFRQAFAQCISDFRTPSV